MADSKINSVLDDSIKSAVPGTQLSTVYVEAANNMKQLESVMYSNELELGFPANTFGSTSTFRISNFHKLLSHIIVKFAYSVPITANATCDSLNDYHAYSLIDNIKYTLAGSEMQIISGVSLLQMALDGCETQDKKAKLLAISKPRTTNHNLGQAAFEFSGYALIPLPWSQMKANNKMPLPLHMASEPLELTITLKPKNQVISFGGNAAAAADALLTQLSTAKLLFEYGKLADAMAYKNPSSDGYKYPMKVAHSHRYQAPSNGGRVEVDLVGFRQAELLEIKFCVINQNVANSSNAGDEVKNIELNFNGQTIYKAEGESQELWHITKDQTPHDFPTAAGTGKCYTIPLSEILVKQQDVKYYSGIDVSKQTLKLSFSYANAAIVNMTYVYNGMLLFDGQSVKFVL